jgi:DNA-binding transcriptional MerR regulator
MQRAFLFLVILLASTLGSSAQQAPPAALPQQPAATQPAPPKISAVKREDLERRLARLQEAYQQAAANLQAINGAIEECKFWLDQIATPDDAVQKSTGK